MQIVQCILWSFLEIYQIGNCFCWDNLDDTDFKHSLWIRFMESDTGQRVKRVAGLVYLLCVQVGPEPTVLCISIDASAGLFYAYDENSIFQVSVTDESRYVENVPGVEECVAALASCSDPF
ncbi:hypothetical protein L1987_48169 [Smallanthus sonchifolius]|uniref:Uncharacterized protein n=1 Tax=Smallanthus sonchifolius TaxID=185202 RepID=A0ACB9FQW5_9ASTR|nr:hypothetical protein L1987_48169 [Smallanthus sonchifolius]